LAVAARAAELKAAGKDIIDFSAGEPDFDTPKHIKRAAIKAIDDGMTKYTPVDGILPLRKAICEKFERENGFTYAPDQVLVSVGCKHSIYNLMQALLNEDDEVIIPAPYWVSYPDMVLLTGAKSFIVETGLDQANKMLPEQLEAAITAKTRLLILNSPSNPSGVAYTKAELAALGEILLQHPQVVVATDDIYEHIIWHGEPFSNILNACPDLYDRTVVLNGVSKAYAMTGWRIGYAAGPRNLIRAMKNLQSQSTSNPTSIAQAAALAAITGDQSFVKKSCEIFKQRHDFIHAELNKIDGVRCPPAQGTFYIFPNLDGAMRRLGIANDLALAEYLLDKAGLAVVPGSPFGAPGFIRLSFATSMENIEKGLARLAKALA
jgi:aspartate aminotransferase